MASRGFVKTKEGAAMRQELEELRALARRHRTRNRTPKGNTAPAANPGDASGAAGDQPGVAVKLTEPATVSVPVTQVTLPGEAQASLTNGASHT
jgi:hypothetical protein